MSVPDTLTNTQQLQNILDNLAEDVLNATDAEIIEMLDECGLDKEQLKKDFERVLSNCVLKAKVSAISDEERFYLANEALKERGEL